MPPINLHKNDPINASTAAKPSGITPQTASQNPPSNPPPTRTTPASTATTTADASAPPPPQPGARPCAPTASAHSVSDTPAPPQPSYTATHLTTEIRGPPPQYHVPPPSVSQLAGRSTLPTAAARGPGPTHLNTATSPAVPAASPFQHEHAGGALPRSSLEGPPGYTQAPDNSPYAARGGTLGTGGVNGNGAGEGEGVGSAAWNMLARAGEALRKGEEAVWKAVRDK